MKRKFIMLVLTLIILKGKATGQNDFYYYGGGTIQLNQMQDRILIRINNDDDSRQKLQTKIQGDVNFQLVVPSYDNFIGQYFMVQLVAGSIYSKSQALRQFLDLPYVLHASYKVYQLDNGIIQALTNTVVTRVKAGISSAQLSNICAQYGYTSIEQSPAEPDRYVLHFPKNSTLSTLQIANALFESGNFEYAEPDFFLFGRLANGDISCSTSDTHYGDQWALQNTGQYGGTANMDINACAAWEYTKGLPCIRIAIIDEGVQLDHPDLNVVLGSDFTGTGGGGAPNSPDAHGTSCAGIAAAIQNNSIGVSGVAPSCAIVAARIAYSVPCGPTRCWVTTNTQIHAGLVWSAQNADVLSNSWGGGSPSTDIDNGIDYAVSNPGAMRGARGCPVVFATGNNNGSLSYPSTDPDVISVGAMSMCAQRKSPTSCDGESWWGGNYGTGLDVVAPGVKIWTTDITASDGYNTSPGSAGDYYDEFNGTSSATPHVAGVVGLMISANQYLTQSEIKSIVEQTARKVGGYTYTPGSPSGSWNNEMGYGLVDARAAVSTGINYHHLYFQNALGTGTHIYSSKNIIRSGNHVTTTTSFGDYAVDNTADISFRALNEITLEEGFSTVPGATFLAIIDYSVGCDPALGHKNNSNSTTNSEQNLKEGKFADPDIRVYPNPTNDNLTVSYTCTLDGQLLLGIKDVSGRVRFTESITCNEGRQLQHVVDMSTFAPGVYFVELTLNEQHIVKKIVKL